MPVYFVGCGRIVKISFKNVSNEIAELRSFKYYQYLGRMKPNVIYCIESKSCHTEEINIQTEKVSIIDTGCVPTLVEYRSSALKSRSSHLKSVLKYFFASQALNTIAALIPIGAFNLDLSVRQRYMKSIRFYLINISKALVQLLKRHKKISKEPLKLGLVTGQL